MKNVVTIGGGTGSYTVLSGIKKIEGIDIKAVVSMADDGGSTGVLRDELGVLPAGDIRQCLVALSKDRGVMREIMSYRFEEGGMIGHSFGNIFLATLEKVMGRFSKGVKEASSILNIKGEVIPVIDQSAKLCIELNDKKIIKGENEINHFDFENIGVNKVYIEEDIKINPDADDAIKNADYILIGPGNQYCSILSALAVNGVKDSFKKSNAKIIYISNLTNKKGHTMNYGLSDYVEEIEDYINKKIDIILFNGESPTGEQIEYYKLVEGDKVLVKNDMENDGRVITENLLSYKINENKSNDTVAGLRSFIRHDSDKLKEVMEKIIS
jgi:uncharacterized cofD-like protein